MDVGLEPWIAKLLEPRARGRALATLVEALVSEGVAATARAWLLPADAPEACLASSSGPGSEGEREPAPALPFGRRRVEVSTHAGRVALELGCVGYGAAPEEEELEALLVLALELDAADPGQPGAGGRSPAPAVDVLGQLTGELEGLEPETLADLRAALDPGARPPA